MKAFHIKYLEYAKSWFKMEHLKKNDDFFPGLSVKEVSFLSFILILIIQYCKYLWNPAISLKGLDFRQIGFPNIPLDLFQANISQENATPSNITDFFQPNYAF